MSTDEDKLELANELLQFKYRDRVVDLTANYPADRVFVHHGLWLPQQGPAKKGQAPKTARCLRLEYAAKVWNRVE